MLVSENELITKKPPGNKRSQSERKIHPQHLSVQRFCISGNTRTSIKADSCCSGAFGCVLQNTYKHQHQSLKGEKVIAKQFDTHLCTLRKTVASQVISESPSKFRTWSVQRNCKKTHKSSTGLSMLKVI